MFEKLLYLMANCSSRCKNSPKQTTMMVILHMTHAAVPTRMLVTSHMTLAVISKNTYVLRHELQMK